VDIDKQRQESKRKLFADTTAVAGSDRGSRCCRSGSTEIVRKY
jgi:hypothetical protein